MSWHPLRECLVPAPLTADPQRRVLAWVRQAWASLAGALPPGAAEPRGLSREGVLTVAVRDEAAAAALRKERAELLKRLQAFLGPEVVRAVRWETGPVSGPALPQGTPPPPPPLPLPAEAGRAAAAIGDPELRARFMAACRALGGAGGPERG
jgi:hypothetical protein